LNAARRPERNALRRGVNGAWLLIVQMILTGMAGFRIPSEIAAVRSSPGLAGSRAPARLPPGLAERRRYAFFGASCMYMLWW